MDTLGSGGIPQSLPVEDEPSDNEGELKPASPTGASSLEESLLLSNELKQDLVEKQEEEENDKLETQDETRKDEATHESNKISPGDEHNPNSLPDHQLQQSIPNDETIQSGQNDSTLNPPNPDGPGTSVDDLNMNQEPFNENEPPAGSENKPQEGLSPRNADNRASAPDLSPGRSPRGGTRNFSNPNLPPTTNSLRGQIERPAATKAFLLRQRKARSNNPKDHSSPPAYKSFTTSSPQFRRRDPNAMPKPIPRPRGVILPKTRPVPLPRARSLSPTRTSPPASKLPSPPLSLTPRLPHPKSPRISNVPSPVPQGGSAKLPRRQIPNSNRFNPRRARVGTRPRSSSLGAESRKAMGRQPRPTDRVRALQWPGGIKKSQSQSPRPQAKAIRPRPIPRGTAITANFSPLARRKAQLVGGPKGTESKTSSPRLAASQAAGTEEIEKALDEIESATQDLPNETHSTPSGSAKSSSSEGKRGTFHPKSRPTSAEEQMEEGRAVPALPIEANVNIVPKVDEAREGEEDGKGTPDSGINGSESDKSVREEGEEGEEKKTPGSGNSNESGKSKLALSLRLLNLSRRGEWILADNLLRTVDRRKIDLSTKDDNGFTALFHAVKENKTTVVEKLLDLGANSKDETPDGRTIAHIAAMYGKDEIVRFLVLKHIDFNKTGGAKGQYPLHMACARPTSHILTMVQLLLRSTTHSVDSRLVEDSNGSYPLHIAIEAKNIVVVKELLFHHGEKQVRKIREDSGDTALHLACRSGSIEIVRLLVEHGALPNVQNNEGQTPLHFVAAEGDESLLRIMYQLRADANIQDKEDRTPLHMAAEMGHTNVVEILTDKFKASVLARTKDGSTLMHIASRNGHSQTALAFLKRGVPLHMPNKSGALGLHNAAMMGHVPVIQTLLSKGTHVDSKTKEGYSALHVAVQSGQANAVEALLGHGADVHIRGGRSQETALHIAANLLGREGRQCAEMLLKSGAEPNVMKENGETPLHVACRRGNLHMVKLLLEEGCDPVATSKVGETPLHVTARYCHYEVSKELIEFVEQERRRDEATMLVNQQTTEGETALHFAAEISSEQCHYPTEDADIMNLLIDYGGDVNLKSQITNETVLHYCARSGNENALKSIVTKIGPGQVQIALNKQSKSGWSPLLESCSKGHLPVIKILLDHHARVDVFDDHGRTGLHLAAENGHKDIVDILLRNKSFVNSKSKLGMTPLHLAAMNGHNDVVSLLVKNHNASLEAGTLESQTPLHFAAKSGQLSVSSALLVMGSNSSARDHKGQTPLHLAAENDHPEVVKLFLKMKANINALTAMDENGFTSAHIAAMKGSMATVKELMTIDRVMVIEAKTKTTESTALHMAAAGGHKHIVKFLLNSGASSEDENANGMTALHLGAKNGHTQIMDVFEKTIWRRCSKKTGLNPLHVSAYFGQIDFVRTMLATVPATARSEPPGSHNPLIVKEFSTEYGLTPLHMAAQSGHEGLVRLLLNYQGVQVDASSATMNVIPLHLAAHSGHIAVVGMLLSRSTQQLNIKDSKGRTALHLASTNGHKEMVSVLIAQGSNINAMDQNGWTALHFATRAGHLNVVKLLVESGADPQAETRDGKVPLCYAASHNHIQCLSYLMSKDHDTHALMEDRRFIFDLMVCGKSYENKSIEDFVLRSPAPIDTAVKLSSQYREMSEKEKERARDLIIVKEFCEQMAVELLSIAASEYNPAVLLKAHDTRGRPFLDVLIENEQKEVVSHASVQRYLTEIWNGGIQWGFGKLTGFFFLVMFCPPVWIFFSLPLGMKMGRAPIIKFNCHLVSHVYLTGILTLVVLGLVQKIYEVESVWPHLIEWVLLFWLSGTLVAELSSHGSTSGLGMIRLIVLFLSAVAILLHIVGFAYAYFMDASEPLQAKRMTQTFLYVRNQFFAFVLLFCFIQYLDFLTVHHLFGPWAIIISALMSDLTRFLVILFLFIAGFTLHVTSIFQPAYRPMDDETAQLMRLAQPQQTVEMLFFSLFGLVEPDNMPPLHLTPSFSKEIMKMVFGIYMMVTLIVLINLLIAMMSDTYQRIQAQSDKEWKFGRAKLIRQMNKKSATPAPINIFTKLFTFLKVAFRNKLNMCTQKAQEDLRMEENIDAFSLRGASEVEKENGGDKDGGPEENSGGKTEKGQGSDMKIETALEWKHVVNLYYVFKGEAEDEAENRDGAIGLLEEGKDKK